MPRPLVFLLLSLPLVGAYALYASGIVVIHQASRVLNLAHGAMAMVPAYITYTLVSRAQAPVWLAVILGVASGALLGIAIEAAFVRRLRASGPTAQTVGTVAVFGLLVALAAKAWGTGSLTAPAVFPEGHLSVGSSILRYGQIGLLVVALLAMVGISILFKRTWFGLALRGAAVNRTAAALMGVDPDGASRAAWALGGALAATAGILLASVTVLHPYTLALSVLPAFVAALIGGLDDLKGALVGSAVVGLVLGLVPVLADLPGLSLVLGQVGGPELVLAVIAMIVMGIRGSRLLARDVRPAPLAEERAERPHAARRVSPRLMLVVLVGWVWIPGVPFTLLGTANDALIYTIVGASLVLLTGWIGQISLAQAAFVGVGAFGSALVSRGAGIPFPYTIPIGAALAAAMAVALGVVALRVRGLYLAVATLIVGWMADQYLFSAPWLVGAGGSATAGVAPIGTKGGFPYFDLAERRTFYLVALAGAALVLVTLVNLRGSKTGRALAAVRGSEVAAASFGVDVTRYKLLGFAISGAIAGLAGSLIASRDSTLVPSRFSLTVSLLYLAIAVVGGLHSLGGLVGSAVLFAALNELFFRVPALSGWLDVVSAVLLAAVLLFYPGGLARAPDALAPLVSRVRSALRRSGLRPRASRPARPLVAAQLRARVRALRAELCRITREIAAALDNTIAAAQRRAPARIRPRLQRLRREIGGVRGERRRVVRASAALRRRLTTPDVDLVETQPIDPARDRLAAVLDATPRVSTGATGRGDAGAASPHPILVARHVSVRFGGVVAVDDVSLSVGDRQIVGLIGPNGAGKTTMFNAVAGLVSTDSGRVLLMGEDVTDAPVHERAARGIARTFQTVQLAGDVSVQDNLLVATHARDASHLASHLLVTARSVRAERDALERVRAAAWLVGIEDVLDRKAGGLPLGTLRLIELARALVTGAPLVMLDEPAAGLTEVETRRFGTLLHSLRETLGISVLLIEHDVRLVTSLCDHVVVLDRGAVIAHGPPQAIATDPAVVAAYLGTSGARVDALA